MTPPVILGDYAKQLFVILSDDKALDKEEHVHRSRAGLRKLHALRPLRVHSLV